MIDRISFKASYRFNKTVLCKKDNDFKPYKASFVELNPNSDRDLCAIEATNLMWSHGKTFAREISARMNPEDYNQFFRKTYAITSQRNNFRNLNLSKILGIAQIRLLQDNMIYLDYLQVNPEQNMFKHLRNFKKVGTAILNSLKMLYPDSSIVLQTVDQAIEFYKANGFKVLDKSYMVFYPKA